MEITKWYEIPLTDQFDSALELLNQGVDALLHMEQSKLRIMSDGDLIISRMGLICDCAALVLNSDRTEQKQKLAPAKQALEKILREIRRRVNVYNLYTDYWCV